MASYRRTLPRRLVLLALAVASAGLAGCTHQRHAQRADMPVEVERRHPIMLSRATQTATVEVGTHRRGVTGIQQADVAGFARAYRADGEGAIALNVPSGMPNETNAVAAAREIRTILEENGVPPNAIVHRPYRAASGVAAPPVVISYTRLRAAVPHRCGVTTDIDTDGETRAWENFGCAAQQNIAAMVANPNDLQGPRPMDRPHAQRRYQVLDNYGRGQDPTTQYRNENAGAVSSVGR